LGTDETAGFGVGTRVVGGGADLDGLLNLEGDCDRSVRCNLLEDPVGEGRCGIAGVADAGFPKFVFVMVVSFLSSFLLSSLCVFSFVCLFGLQLWH